ncbi:MAG: hypothetical protein WA858_06265, partial [Xanthobacteraceae bacterium]
FRRALMQCIASNPASIRAILGQMALYVHVGPFSREVTARLQTVIAALEPDAEPPVGIARASVM